MKVNELRPHTTTGVNFTNVMLSKRSQIPKRAFFVTLWIQRSKHAQNYFLLSGRGGKVSDGGLSGGLTSCSDILLLDLGDV